MVSPLVDVKFLVVSVEKVFLERDMILMVISKWFVDLIFSWCNLVIFHYTHTHTHLYYYIHFLHLILYVPFSHENILWKSGVFNLHSNLPLCISDCWFIFAFVSNMHTVVIICTYFMVWVFNFQMLHNQGNKKSRSIPCLSCQVIIGSWQRIFLV